MIGKLEFQKEKKKKQIKAEGGGEVFIQTNF